MKDYQLIIAGGGFAGLMAAQSAANRGVQCLVLENKSKPGSKIHTTGILVKEAADLLDIPRAMVHKIHGVRLYSPSLQSMDLYSPGYYFKATDTEALLTWMSYNAMQAGAVFRFADPLIDIDVQNNQVQLRNESLSYQYLLGCDGAKSKVARSAKLGCNQQYLFGYEVIYDGVKNIDTDKMHVFIDTELAKGYIAWLLPGVKHVQIGLASRADDKQAMPNFLQKLSKIFDFSQAQALERRAGLIPCGGLVSPFAKNNIMLVGDAAGMVSPLTAGGIQPALAIGRLAGICVSDYLMDQGALPQKIVQRHMPSFTFKRSLRFLADTMPVSNKMVDALFYSSLFRKTAQTVFFHNRGLLSIHTWKEIMFQSTSR